jgi:uncharacterized protein
VIFAAMRVIVRPLSDVQFGGRPMSDAASASPALLRGSGESLLGRVETIEVGGFDLSEICPSGAPCRAETVTRFWLRGGFPRSYLAASDDDSLVWRPQAIARHVEVELPQFGIQIAAPAMLRFWRMLAHFHGQIWSAADPARSLSVSEPTVRRYLDTLTQTLMVRQLQPWHVNACQAAGEVAPGCISATAACCTH